MYVCSVYVCVLGMKFCVQVTASNLHNWLFFTINGNYLMPKVAKTILLFIKSSVASFFEINSSPFSAQTMNGEIQQR